MWGGRFTILGYDCTLFKGGQNSRTFHCLFEKKRNFSKHSLPCKMYFLKSPFSQWLINLRSPILSKTWLQLYCSRRFLLFLPCICKSSGKSEKWVMGLSLTHFKVKCYVLLLNLLGSLKIFHVVVAITYSSFSESQRSINRWNAQLSHLNGVLGLF